MLNTVSPVFVRMTGCGGLVELIGWLPKVRLVGETLGTGPVTPDPRNPAARV